MYVKPTVGSESLRDDEQSLRERLHTHLDPSLGALLDWANEVGSTCNLERTGAGDERLVFDCILDGAQAVAQCVLCALDGVRVRALDEQGDALGFFDILDKGEFFFAEGVFVHEARPAEYIGCQVVDGVLSNTSADEL